MDPVGGDMSPIPTNNTTTNNTNNNNTRGNRRDSLETVHHLTPQGILRTSPPSPVAGGRRRPSITPPTYMNNVFHKSDSVMNLLLL
eukprot:4589736-Prorocentrum_lima.AAC.1